MNELRKFKLFRLCIRRERICPERDAASMLQASKNVEYVYLMLLGSSSFMSNYSSVNNKIEFNNVQINNIDNWDIRKSKDKVKEDKPYVDTKISSIGAN